MLLLVPAQKTNEESGQTINNQQQSTSSPSQFSPSVTATTISSSSSSSSGSLSTTSGRVLIVLPSHTDLTSKLTVSDSSIVTTNFLHHQPSSTSSAPYSGHLNDNIDEQLMGYSGRRRSFNGGLYSGMVRPSDLDFDSKTTVAGHLVGQRQHRRHSVQAGSMTHSSSSSSTSSPFSSNSPQSSLSLSQHLFFADSLLGDGGGGSPFADNVLRRRHSHLGLALGSGCGSGMDPDAIARRLRSSSNSPATYTTNTASPRSGSRPSRRASTLAIPSLSSSPSITNDATSANSAYSTSTTAKSAKIAMTSSVARHATRSFREAFKKSMTVHSPLLTSTSSGMVLDLSPGPEPNITGGSKLRGGGSAVEVARTVDACKAGVGLALNIGMRQQQRQASAKHLEVSPDVHHRQFLVPSVFSSHSEIGKKSRKRSQDEMMEDLYRGIDSGAGDSFGGLKCELMGTRLDGGSLRFNAAAISSGFSVLNVDADSPPPSKKAAVSCSQSSLSSMATPVSGSTPAPPSFTSHSQSQSSRGLSRSSTSSSFASPSLILPVSLSPPSAFAMVTSPSLASPAPLPVKAVRGIQEGDEDDEDEHRPYSQKHQQESLDVVVTTQDISAITASMGALTPLEIQRRLYAHQEKQQRQRKRRLLHHHQQQQQLLHHQQQQYHHHQFLRESMGISHHHPNTHPLPTTAMTTTGDSSHPQTPPTQQKQQYRGIVGGNHNRTVDPFGRRTTASASARSTSTTMDTTSPYQQQQYPPTPPHTRHRHSHQAQLQTQGPPMIQRPSPLSSSATPIPTSASMSHSQYPLYSQQQQLPSCYYLPPSAFRTVSAVAAEEQLEAERKRKGHLYAETKTAVSGEEQTNGEKVEQELEGEEGKKKKKKVEDNDEEEEKEEEEEFLIFPSPTLS